VTWCGLVLHPPFLRSPPRSISLKFGCGFAALCTFASFARCMDSPETSIVIRSEPLIKPRAKLFSAAGDRGRRHAHTPVRPHADMPIRPTNCDCFHGNRTPELRSFRSRYTESPRKTKKPALKNKSGSRSSSGASLRCKGSICSGCSSSKSIAE